MSLCFLFSAVRLGSIAAHEALKTDPRLFKDDVDIRFSKTLNSCKLPQVRYATPERLLQRLIGECMPVQHKRIRQMHFKFVYSNYTEVSKVFNSINICKDKIIYEILFIMH